jgi:hypothetical protein
MRRRHIRGSAVFQVGSKTPNKSFQPVIDASVDSPNAACADFDEICTHASSSVIFHGKFSDGSLNARQDSGHVLGWGKRGLHLLQSSIRNQKKSAFLFICNEYEYEGYEERQ